MEPELLLLLPPLLLLLAVPPELLPVVPPELLEPEPTGSPPPPEHAVSAIKPLTTRKTVTERNRRERFIGSPRGKRCPRAVVKRGASRARLRNRHAASKRHALRYFRGGSRAIHTHMRRQTRLRGA